MQQKKAKAPTWLRYRYCLLGESCGYVWFSSSLTPSITSRRFSPKLVFHRILPLNRFTILFCRVGFWLIFGRFEDFWVFGLVLDWCMCLETTTVQLSFTAGSSWRSDACMVSSTILGAQSPEHHSRSKGACWVLHHGSFMFLFGLNSF